MAAPIKISNCYKFARIFADKTHPLPRNFTRYACCLAQRTAVDSARLPEWPALLITTAKTNARFFSNPSSSPASSPPSLTLTPNSIKRMQAILDKDEYLRIAVDGGGCSGFQYSFEVETKIDEDDDCVLEQEGVRVVVDRISLTYLKGSTIDYSQELIRSAFRVQHNPQAEQGCSCGSSFSIKI